MGTGKEKGVNTFKRLLWLLDTLYKAGEVGITKREIFKRWERKIEDLGFGKPYKTKTYRNHLAMLEEVFDVLIECEKHRYRLYADYDKGMKFSELTNWMLNTISMKSTLVDNLHLRERILFEPIPAGGLFIQPILDAMEASVVVKITYKRYDADRAEKYTVSPYFLKLFRRRWYLVGECPQKGRIYTFALDRIESVVATEKCFEMPEIDETDIFKNYFGIGWKESSEPKVVRIRVYGEQISYIRSLPLHHSQEPAGEGNEEGRIYCDFTYDLVVTYDFIQELLSHGQHLKVIGPPELKKEMRKHVEVMRSYYPKSL